jgi:O-methyltransferase
MPASIGRRLSARSPVRGGRQPARPTAEQLAASAELRYSPSDRWSEELQALKTFLRRAFQLVAYNGLLGDYAEFGCFGARTFRLAWGAARLVGHPAHLWAFDSFRGLPPSDDPRDRHPGWTEGAMSMSEHEFRAACAAHGVPSDEYTTVPGFYADSLAGDAEGPRPKEVSVAYIDCDLYTSTVEVLRFLEPRLRHGSVLAFDDYYCYGPSTASGERLAAAEHFESSAPWRLVPYHQIGWFGMSFVVEDRSVGAGATACW